MVFGRMWEEDGERDQWGGSQFFEKFAVIVEIRRVVEDEDEDEDYITLDW